MKMKMMVWMSRPAVVGTPLELVVLQLILPASLFDILNASGMAIKKKTMPIMTATRTLSKLVIRIPFSSHLFSTMKTVGSEFLFICF